MSTDPEWKRAERVNSLSPMDAVEEWMKYKESDCEDVRCQDAIAYAVRLAYAVGKLEPLVEKYRDLRRTLPMILRFFGKVSHATIEDEVEALEIALRAIEEADPL